MPTSATASFLIHVAQNLKLARQSLRLSQKALAQASGVSQRMIGAIENGTTSVSTATLDRIALALNTTLSDLVRDPSTSRTQWINQLGWKGPLGGTGVLQSSVEARKEIETWEWILQPGERYEAGADPAGWHVLLFIMSGALTLEIRSEETTIPIGSHLFDSSHPHIFSNRENVPVRFFRCTAS